MRTKSTSTPPSPKPRNALQKSSDRGRKSGVLAQTYFDREEADGWRRADMVRRQRMVSDSERMGKSPRRKAVLVGRKVIVATAGTE